MMERAELFERVQGLETLRNAHYSHVRHARSQLLSATARIDTLSTSIHTLQEMSARTTNHGYIPPAGRTGDTRPETGALVIAAINAHVKDLTAGATPQIGTLGSVPLFARLDRNLNKQRQFSLPIGNPTHTAAT